MSANSEERWRTPRGQTSGPQNQNQSNQQRQPSSRTSGGPPQNQHFLGGQGDESSYSPLQDQHIPVRGFNASEVRDALKKAYSIAAAEDGKPPKYKAREGSINNAKSGNPWASKPNTMGNGKDFFLELRKQLSALEQSGERAGG